MPERSSRRLRLALLAAVVVSLAVRLNNVVAFPGMRAPDGFGHFTYIWHLATTGTVPLATAGWSFFHPPLYYAWMAAVWNVFSTADGAARLQIGTAVLAAAGLVHAAVAFAFVRRRHPGRPVLAAAAAGFVLFLPVQLYTAGYLGNEALHAVLASLSLLATIRLVERPTAARASVLGLLLGLAMLTKFTALAIVAGTLASVVFVSIGRSDLYGGIRGDLRSGIRLSLLAGAVAVAVCGWFYVRNLEVYGTPFRMSRDTLAVSLIENTQMQGTRSLAEFLLFDPMIVVRPQWPRGIPLTSDVPLRIEHDALRESVWTGMFANTFFDAVGNQVLPSVTTDETARRAGQILLALALLPTALVLLGLGATVLGLLRRDQEDADIVMLTCFVASMGLFVVGAIAVPMHAAIKATYLLHCSAMFAYWLASGLALLEGRLAPLRRLALADGAALALVAVVVFSQGVFLWRDYIERTGSIAVWKNLEGMLAYAGGNREAARSSFAHAAASDLYLAQENLAALALEDGHTLESLYRMRLAARLQPAQSIGWANDRARLDRTTQAEYRNSIGSALYELGRVDEAAVVLGEAIELDPTIPEVSFDLGLVELERSLEADDPAGRRRLELAAARNFARAYELDPGFTEAGALAAELDGKAGSCRDFVSSAPSRAWTPRRAYPIETTTGSLHASVLHRRRPITKLSPALEADLARRGCEWNPASGIGT
jgi:tetratricopeptide (TPR) repeat protein